MSIQDAWNNAKIECEYIRADLVPQWQPIETAPRDKDVLLATAPILSNSTIGYFDDGVWKSVFDGKPYLDQTWITHWMPLPYPPAT